jgi:CheY-like chemotaxis protein
MRYPLPSFALVDYSLGNFKGTELVRWIRKQGNLSSLPVVIFSGYTEVPQMAECYAAGGRLLHPEAISTRDLLKIVAVWRRLSNTTHARVASLAELAADSCGGLQALKTALNDGLAYDPALRPAATSTVGQTGSHKWQ